MNSGFMSGKIGGIKVACRRHSMDIEAAGPVKNAPVSKARITFIGMIIDSPIRLCAKGTIMARMTPAVLLTASSLFAAVPVSFTSGTPAKADDMNKNFASLDSAIQKKADASAVSVLQTAVAAKADQTTVTSLQSNISGLQSSKVDSIWVTGKISAAQSGSGALIAKNNLSEIKDTTSSRIARGNLGLGALATKSTMTAADVGAIPASNAGNFLPTSGGNLTGPLTVAGKLTSILTTDFQTINQAGSVFISYSGITGAANWAIRGPYQYPNGVGMNSAGGDLDLIKSLDGSTVLATSKAGKPIGFVGVGTTTPSVMLDVAGDGKYSGTLSVSGRFTATGEANFAADTTGAVDPAFGIAYDAKFRKYGVATTHLLVTGTASIHGNIVSKGIPASNVADYVFEPDYKLTSLSEIETYTKEHKHLPEVPSATEIEKGGLDLAQMNLVLLKKVEELTLHAIEQQKDIREQSRANAEQKQEIAELRAMIESIRSR